MRRCGVAVPVAIPDADLLLYAALAREHGNDAHSQYNALVRRLVSFERALECASFRADSPGALSIPRARSGIVRAEGRRRLSLKRRFLLGRTQ